MSSNRYECIATTGCDGIDILTLGNVYHVELGIRAGLYVMLFEGDDGEMHSWAQYYLKQFKLLPRKVKGYIFQDKDGGYYRDGTTRANAHVYTMQVIRRVFARTTLWGRKAAGKWIIVYE